ASPSLNFLGSQPTVAAAPTVEPPHIVSIESIPSIRPGDFFRNVGYSISAPGTDKIGEFLGGITDMIWPESEPDYVVKYNNGRVDLRDGGGPSNGALFGQFMAFFAPEGAPEEAAARRTASLLDESARPSFYNVSDAGIDLQNFTAPRKVPNPYGKLGGPAHQ